MTENEQKDSVIIYCAAYKATQQPVVTIKKYFKHSNINNNLQDLIVMSISYLSSAKKAVSMFLTEHGYVVVKYYEFSAKDKKYKLIKQTLPTDSVEPLFDQFEADCRNSIHLQSLDFDIYSNGSWISKRFRGIHPIRTHSSIVKEFINTRDYFTYSQKLSQQLGRRKDAIEYVIGTLHHWQTFVDFKLKEKLNKDREKLKEKKRFDADILFKYLDDSETDEDKYYNALEELDRIKKEIKDKTISPRRLKIIQKKLPEIKDIINRKDEIFMKIEDDLFEETKEEYMQELEAK